MAKPSKKRPAPRIAARAPGRAGFVPWAALILGAAGFAVYANSLRGPFLFDDIRSIVQNTSIQRLWPLWSMSTTSPLHAPRQTPLAGRPIVNLSFAVNYALGRLGVEGYHAGNVLIHVLAGLILFGVLRRTFASTFPDSAAGKSTDSLALVCALAWSVHPLNTEAVNYITQRTELMMGLFYLIALYAAIRALEEKGFGWWELVAGVAGLCGIASKETMLTLPIIVVLWDRIFAFPSFRSAFAERRRLYAMLAASWLLFAFLAQETPFFGGAGFEERVSRLTYVMNQAPLILQYLKLSIWPHGLVFDYGLPESLTLTDVWPSAALIVVLLGLTGTMLVRRPKVGFWLAWFFITLAPASSVVPIPTEVGAERRMYLSLIAVIVIVVFSLSWIVRQLTSGVVRRRVSWTLGTIAVVALAGATLRRNVDYQSGLSIWQTVLDRRPHARAHEYLSLYLRDAGRKDEAIAQLRMAAPESINARHALGSALLEQGDAAGAIAQFQDVIRLKPDYQRMVELREELAAALTKAGDTGGAAEQYEALLRLTPDDVTTRLKLLSILLVRRQFPELEKEARAFISLKPGNAEAHNLLGIALASQQQIPAAAPEFAEAVRLDPGNQNARANLAQATEVLHRIPRTR